MRPPRLPVVRRRQSGQSFMEYLMVTLVAVVVLATGNPSPLGMLNDAVQKAYTDYSFAMSISTIPNCTITKAAAGFSVSIDKCPPLTSVSDFTTWLTTQFLTISTP